MKVFISLKAKFSFWVTLILTAVVFLLSTVLMYNIEIELKKQVELRGLSIARNLSTSLREPVLDYLREKSVAAHTAISLTLDKLILEEGKKGVSFVGIISNETGKILFLKTRKGISRKKKLALKRFLIQKMAHAQKGKQIIEKKGEFISFYKDLTFAENITLAWIVVGIDYDVVLKALGKARQIVLFIGILGFIMGIVGTFFMTERVTEPIAVLTEGAKIIGKGNLDYRIKLKTSDEIEILAHSFNEMTKNLKKAQQELVEKERMEKELAIARTIQETLVPKEPPQIEGFEIASYYVPAREVGGDYFDFIEVAPGKLGIVVADVSGKGVPAALVMSIFRTLLRSQAPGQNSPAEVLSRVNRLLYPDIKRGMFVTAFYGIIDSNKKNLVFASAGHNPLLLLPNGEPKFIKTKGMVVGVDSGKLFEKVLEEKKLKIDGQAFLVYTDGLTEAMNVKEEEYGEERFLEAVRRAAGKNAHQILETVIEDVKKFVGKAPASDDLTLVVVKSIK